MEGHEVERFVAKFDAATGAAQRAQLSEAGATNHVLMKVETHNHPTAISPFPAHRPATAAKSVTKAHRPWLQAQGRPDRLHRLQALGQRSGQARAFASPLQIMIEGPLGGAAFNNEFGRPT
jgi:phosphoribosylformylglycinamidine synthase